MNKKRIFIFLLTVALSLISCGSESDSKISLSGKLNINNEYRVTGQLSSTFVVVSKTMDLDDIQKDPLNNILELALVESYPYEFSIDLSKADVAKGDKIYIFAFTTDKYVSGVPSISTGDMVGFYINKDNFEPGYTILKGNNSNIEIDVNREVFDFKTSVSGFVNTVSSGKITLVAYAGNITSFDFNDLDIDAVIGYKKIDRSSNSTPFTFDIIPYGYNIPIDNVYIFAFQDKNGNGKPDAGDTWGITSDADGYPSGFTVTDIPYTNLNISLDHELTASTGYKNSISGSFEAPSGYGPGSPPVFMLVCKADDADSLFNDTIDTVKYFKKLQVGETTFELDISGSGLAAGDKVMIIAMWDNDDYTSDFPRLKEGNILGYYMDEVNYTYQYVLNKGTNPPVSLKLNKSYKKNNSSVKGNLVGTESGDVIIVAYTGEFDSMITSIDSNKIIGYKKVTKAAGQFPYSMDILPFYTFPQYNVYLFAILDNNQNGIPDTGDRIGFYTADKENGVPTTLTLNDAVNSYYNIEFTMNYVKEPAGDPLSMSGTFTAPSGYTTDTASKPVFIMVAKADNTDDIFNNPMSSMKYFVKLPQGATSFDIDLSSTGLKAGDSVMILALWDRDYVKGFPSPSNGDMIGYYLNQSNYTTQYILLAGSNPGISLSLDKTYNKNNASVSGTLLGTESGDVILVAYTGEFDSLDAKIDTSKIIGYKKVNKGITPTDYTMDILPLTTFPVDNVYVFAVLDKNGSGTPDNGDRLGFYSNSTTGIPSTVTIPNSAITGLNIEFTSNYNSPGIGDTIITLSGTLSVPAGYTTDAASKPVFIMVAKADNTSDIFSNPMSSLKYFKKLPQGSTSFDIDLSGTGLVPTDKIMIIALWDRDYVSGFPSNTDGDIVGYYIDEVNSTYQYTLSAGENTPVNINLNKTYRTNNSSVSGTLLGTESGDVIIVAYTGEFNSLDSSLDPDKIIGYSKVTKGAEPLDYTMDILPLTTFPVANAFIFAVIDKDSDGIPDSGDRLGFYSGSSSGVPTTLTLYDSASTGINIKFTSDYVSSTPGETSIKLIGTVTAPSGYTADSSSKPIFILVAKADSTTDIFSDPMSSMKYFVKLPQGSTSFNIELSGTGLKNGDPIMIIALWDRDFSTGFPYPTDGDMIGYYSNPTTYSYQYYLIDGENPSVALTLDRTYKTNSASVKGNLLGTESGDVIIIAYSGEINSLDATLDTSKIIGYKKVTKGESQMAYSMDLLPLSSLPVQNVFIMAVLDKDSDGVPDNGDRLGFYTGDSTNGVPSVVTLVDGVNSGLNIEFTSDYVQSGTGGNSITLSGSFTAPTGYSTSSSTKPVYIMIAKTDGATDILTDPMTSLKYFIKLPQGATTFNIELSGTGLAADDKIMIIALWDRDYVAGFPSPSNGDMIGFYINTTTYSYQYTLVNGVNTPVTLSLNKTYNTNSASVTGTLLGIETGDAIIIAYSGEYNSSDAKLDTDKIIGYTKVTKGTGEIAYSMDLFPWSTFPVQNVFIFAILDKNRNGIPDSGDRIGFYSSDTTTGLPTVITLTDSVSSGKDIQFLMDYVDSSAPTTAMSLTGSITAPSGYTTAASTKPIYIIIAKAATTFDLFSDPMSSMKYFVKLPQGTTTYNINLDGTGLVVGDEIRILALWDKNYVAGFPSPDNNDKFGYYQNKTTFNFSKKLTEGVNTASLTNGWSFGIDKTVYKNNAQFTFNFRQSDSSGSTSGFLSASQIIGKDLIVVMVHEGGVKTSDNSYSITDMNYVLSIDYIKAIPNLTNSRTLNMFPFIYDGISKTTSSSGVVSLGGVYIYVILDSNSNGNPDTGEYVGYYWTYFIGQKIPQVYNTIYYDRNNVLSSEVISIFSDRTY